MYDKNVELPPLKGYQRKAIATIEKNFTNGINTLCAMGVGTGKTRVACEIIKKHVHANDGYVLIICPNVALIHKPWSETLYKLGVKSRFLSDTEFEKNLFPYKKSFNHIPKQTYLITYKMLISESYGVENSVYFKNNPPSLIVFDEMHYLSNNPIGNNDEDANKYQDYKKSRLAVLSIAAKEKIGLTATPIVNRNEELKSACEILNGKVLGTENYIFETDSNFSETKITQFFIEIPLSESEYQALDELKIYLGGNVLAETPITQKLLICRQHNIKAAKFSIEGESSKSIVLQTILSRIPKTDKVLIFDEMKASLDYLSRRGWMEKYNPLVYHGSIGKSLQEKIYERFLTDEKYRVFMTTRQIAGEGLNLQVANHIIMLSFGWTPKDIIQTAGRIKRLGQKKDVFIYILKGDYSKHLFSSYNLKPFSEQRHYEKVEEKLAEINENLKNTYNMGFLRTSEIYPNLFKKNDLLREDTVKFIDMVQADYIKREVITKAVAKIKSDISAKNIDTIIAYINTGKAKWTTVENLCTIILGNNQIKNEDVKYFKTLITKESDLQEESLNLDNNNFEEIKSWFLRYLKYLVKSADEQD